MADPSRFCKYCNCHRCHAIIETLWTREGRRITHVPAHVNGRPVCGQCAWMFDPDDLDERIVQHGDNLN